jgi:ABC-2 type transport system ATP-binding protein
MFNRLPQAYAIALLASVYAFGCLLNEPRPSWRQASVYNRRMAIIEISGLCKTYRFYQKKEGLWQSIRGLFHREYRDVLAVRDVNLTVNAGEFVAFLGPNGAGKTTTLKLLSGVINPTAGMATVMGHVPWKRENDYRRRFALVMGQKNQLWWDLPAQESFRLHQHIYAIPREQFQKTQDELTELLDVRRLLNQPVRELSLGERMKMELIAALLHSPNVLFLDEPTIGLDVVAQHNIQQFLKFYQQERQITILLTSHYMKDVQALCERVVIIADGTIQYDGSLSGILDRFSTHKVVSLQLAEDDSFEGLERIAPVERLQPPRVVFRIPRTDVPKVLSRALQEHQVVDVVVEDPPLEQIIAEVFSLAGKTASPPPEREPATLAG